MEIKDYFRRGESCNFCDRPEPENDPMIIVWGGGQASSVCGECQKEFVTYVLNKRKSDKPPIGVVPRTKELTTAIRNLVDQRRAYTEAFLPVPSEWHDELEDLLEKIL